jgi:biopolymer transport protein ExbD
MAGKLDNSQDEMSTISEINVTPFVDVVLVLLVIFMVTTPMLVRQQMSVNLPKAESGEKSATQSISIVIDKTGRVAFGKKIVSLEQIESQVKEIIAKDPGAQAVISADSDAKHGDVIHVLDLVKKAGLTHFAIQIQQK